MWVFLNSAFLSIAANAAYPDTLLVRGQRDSDGFARVRPRKYRSERLTAQFRSVNFHKQYTLLLFWGGGSVGGVFYAEQATDTADARA